MRASRIRTQDVEEIRKAVHRDRLKRHIGTKFLPMLLAGYTFAAIERGVILCRAEAGGEDLSGLMLDAAFSGLLFIMVGPGIRTARCNTNGVLYYDISRYLITGLDSDRGW